MVLSELCESCLNGDLDRVKEYLNKNNINGIIIKYDENENSNDQWTLIQSKELTPLICAIQNNHLSIVQYLFQQGADIYLLQ
jgi:ankyrin repeat protein